MTRAIESIYGLPITEIAKRLGISVATIQRWFRTGVLSRRKIRRKLLGTRVGGRIFIRESDLADFFAALSSDEPDPPAEARTPAAHSREAERAGVELDRIGIC